MKILFICTGNICRSPSAESFLRYKLQQRNISAEHRLDSAGIIDYHNDSAPDIRAIKAGKDHGFDMSGHTARQVKPRDFDDFDLLIALDRGHFNALNAMAQNEQHQKIKLFNGYIYNEETDIKDPYYGTQHDFDQMLTELDLALDRLIDKLF